MNIILLLLTRSGTGLRLRDAGPAGHTAGHTAAGRDEQQCEAGDGSGRGHAAARQAG